MNFIVVTGAIYKVEITHCCEPWLPKKLLQRKLLIDEIGLDPEFVLCLTQPLLEGSKVVFEWKFLPWKRKIIKRKFEGAIAQIFAY